MRAFSILIVISLNAFVVSASASEPCLIFEVLKRASPVSDGPSVPVERLAISQADIRSAVFEVWEPSEESKQHFREMGRDEPSPRPQITVELSEGAAIALQRATQKYHTASPPHHLRISRPGFESFQPRIVVALEGSKFVVPISGPTEAKRRIRMFTNACE